MSGKVRLGLPFLIKQSSPLNYTTVIIFMFPALKHRFPTSPQEAERTISAMFHAQITYTKKNYKNHSFVLNMHFGPVVISYLVLVQVYFFSAFIVLFVAIVKT